MMKFIAFITILSTLLIFSVNYSKTFAQDDEKTGNISAISAEPVSTGHSRQGYIKAMETKAKIEQTKQWLVIDYIAGDIVSSTYVVQEGDTLWEISEAYLEDGNYWNIILTKNQDIIEFLPDGTQALIHPGQILRL